VSCASSPANSAKLESDAGNAAIVPPLTIQPPDPAAIKTTFTVFDVPGRNAGNATRTVCPLLGSSRLPAPMARFESGIDTPTTAPRTTRWPRQLQQDVVFQRAIERRRTILRTTM
jgi:hypothetical protein